MPRSLIPVRRWRRPTLVALLALTLGACAVGPDFQSPADELADDYQVRAPAGETARTDGPGGGAQRFNESAPIAADWYRLFGSPALDALIRQAMENSPSLRASQASLRQAAHQLEAVSGSDLPDLDLSGGATRQRSNGAQIGQDNPMFNNVFNLYEARLALSYDLDLFGASDRETEAQAAQVAYAQNLLRGSMLTLVDNVVVTTVRLAALRDRLAASEAIVRLQRDQAQLLSEQEQAGSVAFADVLRARAQLADSQAQLPTLRHDLATTEHALARLVGADPATFRAPPLSLADLNLPAELPVSLPSELVRQRPDILAAEEQLHAANAQVGLATARLYPNLNLTASLGSVANHGDALFEPAAKVWSLGADLTAPLFHGGTLRANKKAAQAAWEAEYARYRDTVLGAFVQVADVLDAIQRDAEGLSARDHSLEANRDSLALVRKQYRAGAAGYLDVLSAEQRYNQALLSRIDAVRQRYVDTAALYHALGGGWWSATPERNDRTAAAPTAP
ncbi:MAG: efflux transporter outer membrane subunit [Alcanivorax sp.]|uniref:efflux transporter outer membrane subunit n=1 Tax=Alloalcanivorax marinus TaxID=1177169 RepID=UPI00195AE153|nr:efflux transporter outer membrane subunit [Alloalcanivorax marinus]MBM7334560.1 efflux transporter outer membrane subunit [Alloalcanivorax marinus]